jgi:glutathione synthase/RimK-type ligase-like ATP-grasp enzyme
MLYNGLLYNGLGQIIDQAFMPRITEGEVRVLMIGDKPIEILHKKPKV